MIEDLTQPKQESITSQEEIIEKELFTIPESVNNYFSGTMDSRDKLAAHKFFQKYIETNQIDIDYTETSENIDILNHFLSADRLTRKNPEVFIDIFKEAGLITQPVIEKVKKEKVIEHIETRKEEIDFNINEIENTKLSREKIHENIDRPEQFEINPLSNKFRVNTLYEKIESHETESWEFYQKFVDVGIINLEEAQKDYKEVQRIEKLHRDNENSLEGKAYEKNENAKKIATITERGAEYAISQLKWYGSTRMRKAPNYMDKLKATDSLFEIPRNNQDSDLLAIATDVTFSGLESESFKGKVFKLLKHIRFQGDNQFKYGTDKDGNPMRSFLAARTILHFEHKDARLLFEIIEKAMEPDCNIDDLRKEYESCPQKTEFMQQVFCGCEIFGKQAETYQNPIFRQYNAMKNAIKELSWKEPEVAEMIKNSETNKLSLRLRKLVEEYEIVKDRIN